MILQSLVKYYEALLAQGKISGPGWSKVKISFGLDLDCQGEVIGLLPLKVPRQSGKKTVDVPQTFTMPQPVKRSVDIKANFLYDNTTYLMGVDEKGKPDRSIQCFQACRALHHTILDGVASEAAQAVLRYFDRWDPGEITKYTYITEHWKDLMQGGNITFYYEGKRVAEDDEVKNAWQAYSDQDESDGEDICLVTGKKDEIAQLHPSIKGVIGAQAMGTSLVSFNAPAFCSYGKEQGGNAAVGKYAAFAYTTALNELLSDREHARQVGDTTVVCWAESGQEVYQDVTLAALFGVEEDSGISDEDLIGILAAMQKGEYIETLVGKLDPGQHFYMLGLAPNAARLVVRFFYMDTFGKAMENIYRHYCDLEIVRPKYEPEHLSVGQLLWATVNQNARDKSPSPQMAADTMHAVITGRPYPRSLLNGAMMRIRAERKVTRTRAAIIKAYYLRHENKDCPKEVLHMELNEQKTTEAYALGRLFAVLEHLQEEVNKKPEEKKIKRGEDTPVLEHLQEEVNKKSGINATIRDKYFNAASANPGRIFPLLVNLAQKHLRVLARLAKEKPKEYLSPIYFEKKIGELMMLIGTEYPRRLNLPQQGTFQLGYYFQKQSRFQGKKKEEAE